MDYHLNSLQSCFYLLTMVSFGSSSDTMQREFQEGPCERLWFEYSQENITKKQLCIDVCPPTKNLPSNRQFCCRNCPEYCRRCLDTLTPAASPTGTVSQFTVTMCSQTGTTWEEREVIYVAIIAALSGLVILIIAVTVFMFRWSKKTKKRETSETTTPTHSGTTTPTHSETTDGEKSSLLQPPPPSCGYPVQNTLIDSASESCRNWNNSPAANSDNHFQGSTHEKHDDSCTTIKQISGPYNLREEDLDDRCQCCNPGTEFSCKELHAIQASTRSLF